MTQKTKKILLINPPFNYFPGWWAKTINYSRPPLGIAYIAGYIRRKFPSLDVRILDALHLRLGPEDILEQVQFFSPDIIGISVSTPTVNYVRRISSGIRLISKDALVVVGGPHITALPFDLLDVADVAVLGEGEVTFSEIINFSLGQRDLKGIKGIAYRHNGNMVRNPERDFIADLDLLPFPARDLLNGKPYRHIYPYSTKKGKFSTMLTSRGCPYNCYFCANKTMWKQKVRYRSLDNVLWEIEELVKKDKVSLIFIDDDSFTESPQRVSGFCSLLRKKSMDVKWICHARADVLPYELLREMKSSGCVEIQIGAESGNDDILAKCNKKITTDMVKQGVDNAKKAGINVWATFILGNKDENYSTIKQTINFAKLLDPTYATFILLSPLPGTKLFEEFSAHNFIKTFDWDKYSWHGDPVFETPQLPREMLLRSRSTAYLSFYLRFKVIVRYLVITVKTGKIKSMIVNFFVLLKFVLNLNRDSVKNHEEKQGHTAYSAS